MGPRLATMGTGPGDPVDRGSQMGTTGTRPLIGKRGSWGPRLVTVGNKLSVAAKGSGTVDFDEFLVMMVMCTKDESKGKSEEELAELFRMFDK
ncbi:hypothetical protein scyTo_0025566 [Scyliorhinus torazame]|uniref:EF-hand domain-containing protein n=1 Tax=Scyliorhinus torazame TaxID=75743 RepID=A0A401QHE3_SCYTO|nr:hypothetical protein [Scyliorhinus torazame]